MENFVCTRCKKEFKAVNLKSGSIFSCPFCPGIGKLKKTEEEIKLDQIADIVSDVVEEIIDADVAIAKIELIILR